MKRTFVTFASGELYEKLSQVLKSSIESFSNYNLVIYTPSDFDIDYKSDLWDGPRSINFSYKILSCLKALEEYDEIVWLDNDIVVTYNIDKIWNYKIENYPLLPRHRFYNFQRWPHNKIDYRNPELLVKAKEKIGLDNNFENNYLQACCMLFNKKCKDFFDEIMYHYQDYDSSIFPFGDETIINLLIWKNNYRLNLGDVSLCSYYFSPYKIDEFINLKNPEDYPKIFDINYIGFPNNHNQEIQYANHNRLGLIENNFEDILFFHGSKSYELHNSFLTKMINKNQIKRFLPYMNSEEISDLVTYINKDTEMLEIGGGNSTLFFSKIVKRLVTIEHNKEWADKISSDMNSISKCDWSIYVVEPSFPQSHPFQPAEPGQFDDYVNFISNLEKDQFDVVLVDGRDRVRCTIASIPLLRKDGVLIIHDFWNRPKYHSVLQLTELELIKDDNSFENTENTLVAFRKK